MATTTINDDEVAKFTAMAEEWWSTTGKFKPLHAINPVRLAYIRDAIIERFERDATSIRPLTGLRILDIGCGGGLLCEPLTRLGATVVGADASERNITIARLHAEQSGLDIDYRATTSEALAAAGEKFDIVLNMEVVEHVDNVPLYMKSCADLISPGGIMVVSTINRTLRARALAVFAAENILRWLPKGTHDWSKFLSPEEVTTLLERNGLAVSAQTGVVYHPLADQWRLSRDLGINYMLVATKRALAL